MIQEKSCNKLADSVYLAFASHFFNEFKSRLELDVDVPYGDQHQNYTGSFQGTQQRATPNKPPSGTQTQSEIRRQNHDQNARAQKQMANQSNMEMNRQQSIIDKSNYSESVRMQANQQEFKIDEQKYFNNAITGGTLNNTFMRDESSPDRARKSGYVQLQRSQIGEESGQHYLKQQQRNQQDSQILNQTSQPAYQQVNLSKARSQQAGPNQQLLSQYKNYAEYYSEDEKNKGFIKIGDIICFTFVEKVYEGHQKGKHIEQEKDMLLAKYTEKPELEYKGIVFSDGVTEKSFSVIPRQSDESLSASNLYKKCLFRVDVAQECAFNSIDQQLKSQLKDLEHEFTNLDDIDQDGHKRVQKLIDEKEKEIEANRKLLSEENNNNAYEFEMLTGKKVTYGQKIQLRHVFSDEFLTLLPQKMSQEFGCVQISLAATSKNSWFMFTPAQKIKLAGEAISYQDTFYLQNYEEKTKFYLHVNTEDILAEGAHSVLEVNGSYEQSKLRASVFIDYTHLEIGKLNLHSGDCFRLKHQEARGYLTTSEKEVEFLLAEYPDFLLKEIKLLEEKANGKNEKDVNEEIDDMKAIQQDEEKRSMKSKVYIEKAEKALFFTNSCWEIQKEKPFMGGSVVWDDGYRFRHIGTGKYLAVVNNLDLQLKNVPDASTLFKIKKDTFLQEEGAADEPVKSGSHLIIETNEQKFIQIYHDFQHEDLQNQFEFHQDAAHQVYTDPEKSQVPIVNGNFSLDDLSKMVFAIEEVESGTALIVYQAASFFQSLLDFHTFLNEWAVISLEENEGAASLKKYDGQAALYYETDLEREVDNLNQVLLYLHGLLIKAKDESKQYNTRVQDHLAEQGLLQILVKIMELIYYKTTPFEERELAFANTLGQKNGNAAMADDYEAETIAREYLDPVVNKILKILLLMIKFNQKNAERVTKYDAVIFQQLKNHDTVLIASIFKETFKRSEFIHGDKSAVITNKDGIDNEAIEKSQDPNSGTGFNQSLGNQLNKWVGMLEQVKMISEDDENISKQILYLDVISMICRDNNGKGVYHYQIQAAYNLLQDATIILKFGKKDQSDRPMVYFTRKRGDTNINQFFQKNPMLREIYKQPISQGHNTHNEKTDIIFDLVDISTRYEFLGAYIDYICAVINLYCHMCLSRNHIAIAKVQKVIGLDYDHIQTCINHKSINEKLKAAYVFAAKVLYIDNDPFPTLLQYRNRCYFWKALKNAKAHRTMYKWEKQKYDAQQQRQIDPGQKSNQVEDAISNIRQNVVEFFTQETNFIQGFFYGYENKRFTKADIDPKLKLVTTYIDTATSLIECEHSNSHFINCMLENAAYIFIGYAKSDLPVEWIKEHWIVILITVAKKIKACRNKVELLEQKTLKMLEMICNFRLNQQVLKFLQMFRYFQERCEQSHIDTKISTFDKYFHQLFSFHQFDVSECTPAQRLSRLGAQEEKDGAVNIEDIQLDDSDGHIARKPSPEEIQLERDKNVQNQNSLFNNLYPLSEFLLYFIFSKNTNEKLRNTALNVLVRNFKQREIFVQEIVKIELIVSKQDQQEYRDIKFQHSRLTNLIEQMTHDDYYYWLYQVIDKAKTKTSINDVTNILAGLTQIIKSEPGRIHVKQNMVRHLDVGNDLINNLMKKLYYKAEFHFGMFKEIVNFLFMFCYQNPNNQRCLLPHLNYLVTLTDKNIQTPKLISQIIINNKDTEYGMKFLEFLINKIITKNQFKSSLFKLLTIMATGNSNNQIFILKRLIKKKRFRKRLYMDKASNDKKVELILNLKRKISLQTHDQRKESSDDQERVDIHLQTCQLLSVCAKHNIFGVMQARKIISVDNLFDSLLSEAVPYQFKKYYFRLLFEVYIDEIKEYKDITMMDINSQRFLEVMQYVVLENLRYYCAYYTGLMVTQKIEVKRDNDIERDRDRVRGDLEKFSKQQFLKIHADKNQKEIDDYKEMKARLSGMKSQGKNFPLIDDADFSEYWTYLSKFNKSEGRADGLLHFVIDFYRGVRESKSKMSKDLIETTVKIRETLMQISDDLHKLLETFKDHLGQVESILQVVIQAIGSIPNVRTFKAGKKFNVKGGGDDEEEDQEAQVITDESNIENNLDESQILDVRIASDKVLRIVRDHIISRNEHIRDAFRVQSIQTDFMIKRYQLKKMLKEIAGSEASYDEIEKAIQFFVQFSKDQQQERRIMQQDLGQEGHIKQRQEVDDTDVKEYINFRDFEVLLKKILQKHGYKPAHQKREKNNDEEFRLEMVEDQLSLACNNDLKHYIKCFFDFYYKKFQREDEIMDLVEKISKKFQHAFEHNQPHLIGQIISKFKESFEESVDYKIHLMTVFNLLLHQYQPNRSMSEEEMKSTQNRRYYIQKSMIENGACDLILACINYEEERKASNHQDYIKMAKQGIELLSSLLQDQSTDAVQAGLLALMAGRENFQFLVYLKNRIIQATDILIDEVRSKEVAKYQQEQQEQKMKALQAVGVLSNLHSQPFYLPDKFDLENELNVLQQKQSSNELLVILKLLQLMCDNCYKPFQNYLRDQETGSNSFKITSVNLVSEVANTLIKLTAQLNIFIFSDYTANETIHQIFRTLIDFLYGPCEENQKILGSWKKLYTTLNWYLSQDMGIYQANTTELQSKLSIMNLCTKLMRALVDTEDLDQKKAVINYMIGDVKIELMRNRLVDIYLYKIGGTEKRLRNYYENKVCAHYKLHINDTVRLNMCEKNEVCQYGHLIPFDKRVISSAFNLFILLQDIKDMLEPAELSDFEIMKERSQLFRQYYDEYAEGIKAELKMTLSRQRAMIIHDEEEKKQKIKKHTEDILQHLLLNNPSKHFIKVEGEDLSAKKVEEEKTKDAEMEGDNSNDEIKKVQFIRSKTRAQVLQEKSRKCKCLTKTRTLVGRWLTCGRNKQNNNILPEEPHESEQINEKQKLLHAIDMAKSIMKQDLMKEEYNVTLFKNDLAYRFFISNVARIEIDFKGKLVNVTYKIPSYCTFFTQKTQLELVYNVSRSSQQEKLEDFFSKIKFYRAEMLGIQQLARNSKLINSIAPYWRDLSKFCFFVIVFINIMYLAFYEYDSTTQTTYWTNLTVSNFVEIIGVIQTIVAFLVVLLYYFLYRGAIKQQCLEGKQIKFKEEITKTKGSIGYSLGSQVHKEFTSEQLMSLTFGKGEVGDPQGLIMDNFKTLIDVMKYFLLGFKVDSQHIFNTGYFIVSLFAVFYTELYSILLLDFIVKIPLLRSVVNAIVQNKWQLAYTGMLLIIIIYIYSFFGITYLQGNASDSNDPTSFDSGNFVFCDTLYDCFTTYVNLGIRSGGGIGDQLASLPQGSDDYWFRLFYDLSFFIIIIVLLLNLVFGIIIDAFGNMRDQRKDIADDVQNKCFVCGIHRLKFEMKSKSFTEHIQREHNVYAYLYFILYVYSKKETECTGVEKYVKDMIKEEDVSFFPINRCLALNGGAVDESTEVEEE